MWFGVLYLDAEEPAGDGEMAVVVAYGSDGATTVGGPPESVATSIRMLRLAAGPGGMNPPYCRCCGEPVAVPPLDVGEDACAST